MWAAEETWTAGLESLETMRLHRCGLPNLYHMHRDRCIICYNMYTMLISN